MGQERGIQTTAVHAGDAANPTTAVSSPIYQTATFRFDSPEAIAAAMIAPAHPQFYGRYATPNTKQVEATIAALEQGEAALATASGMAAISLALLTELKAGDHVVAQRSLYPTTRRLLDELLPQFGIGVTLVDQMAVDAFTAAIQPDTRLIYTETPSNPTLMLTDLAAVADLARARGVVTLCDNTFATPFNQRPLTLGIDIVVHSATKYLSGHSDVVAGAVVASEARIARMWSQHMLLGGVLHPQEAWLLERGLKTFGVRMRQHNASAQAVAAFLAQHPAVAEVYYPGLEAHPQHALAQRQMSGGFGGMVCFDLKGGREAGYRLVNGTQLISLAVSLGGVHSLITHAASTVAAVMSDAEMRAAGIQPGLVRLSVGLEDTADIIADLAQALDGVMAG